MRAREDTKARVKKRRAIPNPNEKSISIHNIPSKGGTFKDLGKGLKPEEPIVVKEEEDIYGVSDKEIDEEEGDEVPAEIQTRSGRNIRKPSRYKDSVASEDRDHIDSLRIRRNEFIMHRDSYRLLVRRAYE